MFQSLLRLGQVERGEGVLVPMGTEPEKANVTITEPEDANLIATEPQNSHVKAAEYSLQLRE